LPSRTMVLFVAALLLKATVQAPRSHGGNFDPAALPELDIKWQGVVLKTTLFPGQSTTAP
jgi:hypothetical protein